MHVNFYKKPQIKSLNTHLKIDNSVLFYDQILKIESEIKPNEWIHIGPGNVTAGMVKKSISSKEIRVINSLESLSK